jgi:general secretion pathway protein J
MAGFTLVEFLVAITLLGIIMVILYGGLRVGIRSSEAVLTRTENIEEIRVAQGFLRRQLRQSRALYWNDPEAGQVLAFSGEAERMEFVAPISRQLGLGGLYRFTLSLDDAGGESASLHLDWRSFQPVGEDIDETADELEAEQRRVVLVERVRGVEFAYYGEEVPGDGADWHEEWPQDAIELPRLVRVRLDPDERTWPDLVASLRSRVNQGGGGSAAGFGPGLPFGGRLTPPARGESESTEPTQE